MRVGLVSPYSLSAPGGVQTQVLGLADELRRLGHHVAVIGPTDGPPLGGVTPVGRSIPIRVNGSVAPMAPHPSAAVRTLRTLRQGGFDVVHLHEPLAPSITIPALVAHPAPLVGTFHAAGDRTPYRWLGGSLRRLAGRLDARVAVSETAARLAHRHLGGTYEVLFNGIDVRRHSSADPARVDAPTVLFLGRHEPRKGLDVLLAAMAQLPDDLVLWVAGDGPEHHRLRRRHGADARIRWLGRLGDDDKIARLRAATVVCVPSLHGESFGIVLLEAMAAGTPVVASDLPAYRALTDHGRAAHLVAAGDATALAGGLLHVLHDPCHAADLRASGERLTQRYTLETLARRYVTIYERVA